MDDLINEIRLKAQEIVGNYLVSNNLKYLRKSQFFNKEKILHDQSEKLRKLINFAAKNIKFYSDFFKNNNLQPSDIKGPDDLIKLPVMTKEIYRKNFPHDMTDQKVPKRYFVTTHTSGSTASFIDIYTPHEVRGLRAAMIIFIFEWAGRKYGEPFVRVQSADKINLRIKLFNKLIGNTLVIDAFNLSDSTIHKVYKKILAKKPKLLEAFTSSAHALALLLERHDLKLNIPSTIVSGETLHDFQKDIIKKQLNTEIYNRYACREFGTIAQECPKYKGFHILQENAIVEILDDNNEPMDIGDKGKIVITGLDNFLNPFIRYQIDDIGALSTKSCACGRNWQMLKFIEGRVSDMIYSPRGRHVSLLFFINIFEKIDYKTVKEFQVVQIKNNDKLIIKIVPGKNYNKNIAKGILNQIDVMDDSFQVFIEKVEKIPLEPSGKKKFLKII